MLILIAEAKTMLTEERPVTPADFAAHTPAGEEMADFIMGRFATMSVAEIAEITGLTHSLSGRLYKLAYEFANKSMGLSAIEAFTGVVFKALDYASLSSGARQRCGSDVGIISSLYGWLRPEDIVKPYRLDYTSKIPARDGREVSASGFWKKDVTIQLVRAIQEGGHREVLNLLPGDAAKCIDWKLTKNFAKVYKTDFTDALTGATPAAGKLKQMRGLLLRQILEEGTGDCSSMTRLASDAYVCDGTPRYPDHLHFIC